MITLARFAAGLKGGGLYIFGSANLAGEFIQHQLIDKYQIMLHPLVLGSGNNLFQGINQPISLKRSDIRAFTNGNVLLTYRPA